MIIGNYLKQVVDNLQHLKLNWVILLNCVIIIEKTVPFSVVIIICWPNTLSMLGQRWAYIPC